MYEWGISRLQLMLHYLENEHRADGVMSEIETELMVQCQITKRAHGAMLDNKKG